MGGRPAQQTRLVSSRLRYEPLCSGHQVPIVLTSFVARVRPVICNNCMQGRANEHALRGVIGHLTYLFPSIYGSAGSGIFGFALPLCWCLLIPNNPPAASRQGQLGSGTRREWPGQARPGRLPLPLHLADQDRSVFRRRGDGNCKGLPTSKNDAQ